MELRNFKTLINKDHKFGANKYVFGRIYGIAEIICELYEGTRERTDEDGNIHTVGKFKGIYKTNKEETVRYLDMKCTAEQYEKFKNYVEEIYPGLCTFNCEK